MHKVSYLIVTYTETNNLNTLFVGKNIGWKEGINIRKTNNQNFVNIPYNLIIVNEAYTSKYGFIK